MGRRPGGRFGKSFYQRLNDEEKQQYKNYLDGTSVHTMNRPATGAARKRSKVSVYPFGRSVAASTDVTTQANRFIAPITAQAKAIADLFTLSADNDFGYQETTDSANINASNFSSALIRISLRDPSDTGNGTRVSAFSKKTVKTLRTRSGGIPIGRVSGATNFAHDYSTRIINISTGVRGQDLGAAHALNTISFVPEYWDIEDQGLEDASAAESVDIDY